MLRSLLLTTTTLALTMPIATVSSAQNIVEDGRSSWYDAVPPGESGPSDEGGNPVVPNVTDDFVGHASTNDWCSSIFWHRQVGNRFGSPMYAMPLAFQASPDGLLVGRPPAPWSNDVAYSSPFGYDNAPMRITVDGLSGADFAVADVGDWTVTPRWTKDGRTLEATFGHGMPFVYATVDGGRPVIDPKSALGFELIEIAGREACFRIAGQVYTAYASEGRTWIWADDVFTTDLTVEDDRFAVACLPDATAETRAAFRAAADAVVVDSRVDWRYDAAASEMVVDFEFVLDPGSTGEPIVALFRHQSLDASLEDDAYLPGTLSTVRGDMKLLASSDFQVRHPFNGIVPHFPDLDQFDRDAIAAELADVLAPAELVDGRGTYWNGKSLGRAGLLLPIAEQLGDDEAADRILSEMKAAMEDWLHVDSTSDEPDDRFLAYDADWGAVIGYPGGFGSTNQLNDHHFHYGYLIMAAATIAQRDPAWADEWGGAVEMLIRDVANWDRDDDRFPFLRNFDPYAGHAHASGHAAFANGNNQESSSESINFATATFLWGAVTGDEAIRDLGIFLHAVESKAIEQYWFDADDEIFPADYPHAQLGIVWSNGGDYATWWTPNPEEIHGINLLPINTGSLHLGRHPSMMVDSYAYLRSTNFGPPTTWQGILWSGLAMGAPTGALTLFEKNDYTPEPGTTRAHTRHWIESLAAWGRVDVSVTADVPYYAVFSDGSARTHLAWNPTSEPITATFSDGVSGCVPPGEVVRLDADSTPCPGDDVPGDIDGDGKVGGADLGIIISSWGDCTAPDCTGDLTGDGKINGADLGVLFSLWTA